MRILVISDTHGNEQGLLQAVEEQPNARAVIHLGDGAREAQAAADRFPGLPFYLVRGNCDWASTSAGLLYAREETFAGKRIFFTHGHLYEVKFDLYRAACAARERQADVLLFGRKSPGTTVCCCSIPAVCPAARTTPTARSTSRRPESCPTSCGFAADPAKRPMAVYAVAGRCVPPVWR